MTAQKWGRLTLIAEAEPVGGRRRCTFRCDCGVEKVMFHADVTSGRSRSCGCQRGSAWRSRAGAEVAAARKGR